MMRIYREFAFGFGADIHARGRQAIEPGSRDIAHLYLVARSEAGELHYPVPAGLRSQPVQQPHSDEKPDSIRQYLA